MICSYVRLIVVIAGVIIAIIIVTIAVHVILVIEKLSENLKLL